MGKSKIETTGTAPAGALAFLLSQVGGLAAMKFGERLGSLSLTPARAGLLRAVANSPGRSQRALAQQLGTLPSRLVILVDELEADGLLERRVSPRDRRISELHLTKAGEDLMLRIGRTAQAHGDDLLAPLTATERSELAKLLRRVADHHGLTDGVHPGYRSLPATVSSTKSHQRSSGRA